MLPHLLSLSLSLQIHPIHSIILSIGSNPSIIHPCMHTYIHTFHNLKLTKTTFTPKHIHASSIYEPVPESEN